MSDDDWAKEGCDCRHSRFHHARGIGRCDQTRLHRVAPPNLPPAAFDEPDDPFEFPKNWPPYSEWPEEPRPCCDGFQAEGTARAEAGPE